MTHFNPLFWEEGEISNLFLLWENFEFDHVNGAKGARLILEPADGTAVRCRQRRWKERKSPPIQVMLKQAFQLKARLDADPSLNRDTLAKDIGISPSYLSRILNLLNLAPEIKLHILRLPNSQTKGPITENKIKKIARMLIHNDQRVAFKNFFLPINGKIGTSENPSNNPSCLLFKKSPHITVDSFVNNEVKYNYATRTTLKKD